MRSIARGCYSCSAVIFTRVESASAHTEQGYNWNHRHEVKQKETSSKVCQRAVLPPCKIDQDIVIRKDMHQASKPATLAWS